MYYYNILQPQFICDKAIKFIQQQQTKIAIEIGNLQVEKENKLENAKKIQGLSILHFEYSQLIEDLKLLGEFGIQQMKEIIEKGEQKGDIIY